MGEDRSRADLTDEVKADAAELWTRLLRLYKQGAHTARGYSSWGAYCRDEFAYSKSRAYEFLDAGKVDRLLAQSGIPERPTSEGVANELVPVLRDDPERVPEVWGEVVALPESPVGERPASAPSRASERSGEDPRRARRLDARAVGRPPVDSSESRPGHRHLFAWAKTPSQAPRPAGRGDSSSSRPEALRSPYFAARWPRFPDS